VLKVVSFDLDGTLVKKEFTDKFWLEAIPKRYSELYNIPYSLAKERILKMYEEVGQEDLRWYMPSYWIDKLGLKSSIEDIVSTMEEKNIYYEDVKEVLDKIYKRYTLIIISSNPRDFLEYKIREIKYFFKDYISSIDDFKIPKKSEEVYLFACNKMKIKPNEMLHVGDDPIYDYFLPKALGIKALLLDRKGKNKNMDKIASLLDLLEIVNLKD